MTTKQAQLLLAAVIGARGTSFMFNKLLLDQMGPMTLMGLRFLLAFGVLALVFHKRLLAASPGDWIRGGALGAAFYLVMACELTGLVYCGSSLASLLENTALVMVPVFTALAGRRLPDGRTMACALIILAGVGGFAYSPGGFAFGKGEAIMVLAAVLYALTIILTSRLSVRGDTAVMGIVQVGVIGALGMVSAFLSESPVLPQDGRSWVYLLVLALVCSGFGFTLQPVAQRHLSADQAGMFCAIGPLVATVLGLVFLGEQFTASGVCGIILVLAGLVAASLPADTLRLPRRKTGAGRQVRRMQHS